MAIKRIKEKEVVVPADVPREKRREFIKNYLEITRHTGRLMLFAGDQKIEHLNDDFYGEGISSDDASPRHLFEIASRARIGCFASQFGLISRYGQEYRGIPYLVKLNSKTNLLKKEQRDPLSAALWRVSDVIGLKRNSKLRIPGVGYTIYVGSRYEHIMLSEAAGIIHQAHQEGLVGVLWAYPRGKSVENERDAHLIAGAAGLASSLGADFVKINEPDSAHPEEDLREAVLAAGNTGLVCAGGESVEPALFLERLYKQIHRAGISGSGTGRNIHQKPLKEAIRMADAISAIVYDDKTAKEALSIYRGMDAA